MILDHGQGFAIFHGVLDAHELLFRQTHLMAAYAVKKVGTQTGVGLIESPMIAVPLEPLNRLAQDISGYRHAKFDLSRSSFRIQPSTPDQAFPPHQDRVPTGTDRALTFWVPMVPIGPKTPSIAFGNRLVKMLRPHGGDKNGYAKLIADEDCPNRVEGIGPGDVVAFSPYAVHRTSLIEGSTEERRSLDVRCFWPNAFIDGSAAKAGNLFLDNCRRVMSATQTIKSYHPK